MLGLIATALYLLKWRLILALTCICTPFWFRYAVVYPHFPLGFRFVSIVSAFYVRSWSGDNTTDEQAAHDRCAAGNQVSLHLFFHRMAMPKNSRQCLTQSFNYFF